MSELKAYNVVATADVNPEVVDILGCTEWLGYDKDEADKVIAEKDEEIRRLNFQMWSARCEAAEAERDEPRLARCRYMADKFKETK